MQLFSALFLLAPLTLALPAAINSTAAVNTTSINTTSINTTSVNTTDVNAAPVNTALIEDSENSFFAAACLTTCGSTCYTSAQVTAAENAAAEYVASGSTAGSSTYPHVYNNYEGFDFLVSGTYYEFPIKSSGVYTGGSPGADRVVINKSGARAGEITHTGASGNNFVGCTGTSTS